MAPGSEGYDESSGGKKHPKFPVTPMNTKDNAMLCLVTPQPKHQGLCMAAVFCVYLWLVTLPLSISGNHSLVTLF